MALPPTIPTSFVPKQPVSSTLRKQKSGMNVLLIISGVVLAISVLASAGVFGYEIYLKNAREVKAAQLTEAQKSVDIDMIEGFIRLRDRLRATETILNQHIGLSEFFDVLEDRTLQSVRFSGLSISVDESRASEIELEGVARSFNALAAQSAAVAAEKRIKRAIFSDISVNANGTVGFSLSAELDPRLITSGDVLPGISDSEPAPTPTPAAAAPAPSPVAPATTTTAAPRTATTTRPATPTTTP